MQRAAQAYFQTQVGTTNQGELLLLLYSAAIRFLNQAKEKIAEKDVASKGILISKAMDIINELDNVLDTKINETFSNNMHQLYFLCNSRLLRANMHLDISLIDSVIDILTSISSAYAEVVNTPEAQNASQQISEKNSAKNAGFIQKSATVNSVNNTHTTNTSSGFAAQAYAKNSGQQAPPAPQTPSLLQLRNSSLTQHSQDLPPNKDLNKASSLYKKMAGHA